MRSPAFLLAGLLALPAPGAAPDRWSDVVACAKRSADERARHDCVDDVLRGAGVLGEEQQRREQRLRFGRNGAVESRVADAPASAAAEPDMLEMTLSAVTEARDGKLVVTTQEGAVWRQTDDKIITPTPAAGQAIVVRKATLGSFFCQVNGRAGFRCARSR